MNKVKIQVTQNKLIMLGTQTLIHKIVNKIVTKIVILQILGNRRRIQIAIKIVIKKTVTQMQNNQMMDQTVIKTF